MTKQDLNKWDSIKVYTSVSPMTGVGEEWLQDSEGNVLMIFIDGWFQIRDRFQPQSGDPNEVTKGV